MVAAGPSRPEEFFHLESFHLPAMKKKKKTALFGVGGWVGGAAREN